MGPSCPPCCYPSRAKHSCTHHMSGPRCVKDAPGTNRMASATCRGRRQGEQAVAQAAECDGASGGPGRHMAAGAAAGRQPWRQQQAHPHVGRRHPHGHVCLTAGPYGQPAHAPLRRPAARAPAGQPGQPVGRRRSRGHKQPRPPSRGAPCLSCLSCALPERRAGCFKLTSWCHLCWHQGMAWWC